MPGSIQNAVAAAVLPLSLSRAFAHSREFPVAVNEFVDGSAQRGLLANASRKRWRLAKRLSPAKMAELRAFYEARKGAHEPFYSYDPYGSNPKFSSDPTGASPDGRYVVCFDGAFSQEIGMGRANVELTLVQLA